MTNPFPSSVGRGVLIAALMTLSWETDGVCRRGVFPLGWMVWSSNRQDGRPELYLARADGTDLRRLTDAGGKTPLWSPDGTWIAYNHPDLLSTHLIRPDGSQRREVCPPGDEFNFWLPNGQGLVCGHETYYTVDLATEKRQRLFTQSEFIRTTGKTFWPGGLSPDGRWLVAQLTFFLETVQYDNGQFFTFLNSTVALDFEHQDRLYFIGPGCGPRLSPINRMVVHTSWNASETLPDVYSLDLADLQQRETYRPVVAFPDADWGHEYWANFSTDGKWLTYAASTGCQDFEDCNYDVFLRAVDAPSTERRRVTWDEKSDVAPHLYVGELWSSSPPLPGLDVTSPSIPASPGGCSVLGQPPSLPLGTLALWLLWGIRRRS